MDTAGYSSDRTIPWMICKTNGQLLVRKDCISGSVLSFSQVKAVCILQIRGTRRVDNGFFGSCSLRWGQDAETVCMGFMGLQGLSWSLLDLSNKCVRTSTHPPLYMPFCNSILLHNLLPHKFRGKCWHMCLELGVSILLTAGLGRQDRKERQAGRAGRSRPLETGKNRAICYKASGDGNCCVLLSVWRGERSHLLRKAYWY